MYLTTSKRLDQHRDLFSLSTEQLNAYVLGSAPITTENQSTESINRKFWFFMNNELEPAIAIFGYDAERAINILDVLRKMEQIIIHQNERLNQLEQQLNISILLFVDLRYIQVDESKKEEQVEKIVESKEFFY